MKKEERIERIMEMLRRENGLPVQLIADHLGVSHMTVRRDLDQMAENDLVRLIHGGVILSPRHSSERIESPYSLHTAGVHRAAAKRRIGARASDLVGKGETLIVDSGSTTECLARSLPPETELTVLSYALNIVSETARMPKVRSVFAGGMLHANTLMFESQEGLALLRRFRATKAFISAAGISLDFGVTCANEYERETKLVAMESSVEKILIADSSKFGVVRSEFFAGVEEFDVIVTDVELPSEYRDAVNQLGIELILA